MSAGHQTAKLIAQLIGAAIGARMSKQTTKRCNDKIGNTVKTLAIKKCRKLPEDQILLYSKQSLYMYY